MRIGFALTSRSVETLRVETPSGAKLFLDEGKCVGSVTHTMVAKGEARHCENCQFVTLVLLPRSSLNSIAQLFEFEVDAEGNTHTKNNVNNGSLGGYSMYHHLSPVGSIARWR